jgi:hypothetical protein
MALALGLYGFRLLLLLVYVIAALAAVVRRTQLGEAASPAAFGFGVLAIASVASGVALYLPLNAVAHHESVQSISPMIGILGYVGQALAFIGEVLVVAAMFLGRPKVGATPNNRWSGP